MLCHTFKIKPGFCLLVFRDFTFSHTCIYFLLTLSLLWSSFFFISLLWLFPPLLFHPSILSEVCAGLMMMMIIIFMIIMIIMMMSQWPQQSVPSNVLQAIAEAQVCKIITYAKKQSLSTRAWAKPFQKHFFLMLWHFLASRIHHSSVSTEGGGDFANWIISFNLSTNDLSLKRWNMVLKKHTWSQITGMVESLPSCYLFLLYHHVQVYSFL